MRTFSINRPGGHGKITKLHTDERGQVVRLDVKYILTSSYDLNLDPELVQPFHELDRNSRRRRRQRAATDPEVREGKENERSKPLSFSKKAVSKRVNKKKKKTVSPSSSTDLLEKKRRSREAEAPMSEIYLSDCDDTMSMVSELGFGAEAVSSGRSYMLPASQRKQRQSFETTCSAIASNEDTYEESDRTPISRAKSMGSGQLSSDDAENKDPESFEPSFSKTKSLLIGRYQQSTSNQPKAQATLPQQVSLAQVYQSEKQRAAEFCKQVVLNNDAPGAEATSVASSSCHASTERRNRFVYAFTDLLQMDGMMQVDEVVAKVNANASLKEPFLETEVTGYLGYLAEQNKIMESDGLVYSI